MALEFVCGADLWCNRHCKTSPVVLEGFWGQAWPKIGRKPAQQSEFRIANEPLSHILYLIAQPTIITALTRLVWMLSLSAPYRTCLALRDDGAS